MGSEINKVDRRTLLQLISSSLLAPAAMDAQTHCGEAMPAEVPSGPYQFQFFTPAEAELIETVMEKIIPQDDHSPGARKARVIEFADLMTATGPEYLKEDWHTGARLLAAELQTRDLDSWLASAAQNEENPQTVLDIFFRTLKQMTINGYYSSAVGIHEDLHYQGNTYLTAFVGCEHPEHKG